MTQTKEKMTTKWCISWILCVIKYLKKIIVDFVLETTSKYTAKHCKDMEFNEIIVFARCAARVKYFHSLTESLFYFYMCYWNGIVGDGTDRNDWLFVCISRWIIVAWFDEMNFLFSICSITMTFFLGGCAFLRKYITKQYDLLFPYLEWLFLFSEYFITMYY